MKVSSPFALTIMALPTLVFLLVPGSLYGQTINDDFNRPDGPVGNGWSLFGAGATLAGGQLQTIGANAVGGGIVRNLSVSFPLTFSFDFSTANPAEGGWFIAFNAKSTLVPGPAAAQISFIQFAGSRNIQRNINDPSEASPNLPEPIPGWENYSSAMAHVQGHVNADLSAVITVTYADGAQVTASWAATASGPIGTMLVLGNSSAYYGPHYLDNLAISNRSGVLSHIAAGGGWSTVMTLVNTSSMAAPVTVVLRDDNGSALPLPLTTTLDGVSQTTTTASLSATIKPNATLLISTGDQIASTVVGWADVLSTGSLSGYAIFRSTPQTGSPSEGTVPLQLQFPSTITLPYDNTAGFVMGVALANLATTFTNVTVVMWDDIGNQLGTQNLTIGGSGHTAFVLPNQFPLTAGKRGIVKFQATGGITGLGLRFSPFGTFTSVPTI